MNIHIHIHIHTSERHKNLVDNVNKPLEEVWKITKEKEMPSKKTKKDYKRDLIQHLNHQTQQGTQGQNQRNTSSYHPSNNERYDQFNSIQLKNFK